MSQRLFVTGAVASLVLVTTACGGTSDESSGAPEADTPQTVTIGQTLAPPTLDLTVDAAAAIPQALLYNVYETLVQLDDAGELQPLLATNWEVSEDGMTYTFDLREATFSNGEALTADDVVFSIERALSPDTNYPSKDQMEPVSSVRAIDDRTVEVTLGQPSNTWLFHMSQTVGIIFNEDSVADLATEPVGTGPYMVAEHSLGYSLTLAPNPQYDGEAAPIEEVVFRYIEDPNALTNAALAGDVDIIGNVSAPETLSQFENNPEFDVVEGVTEGQVVLSMNNARAPFDNPLVRQAITHAIDREALLATAYAGYGTLIGTWTSPANPWFQDLQSPYPYDPERARELLAEAGHQDGLTVSLALPPPNYARSSGQFIAAQLEEVGITVTIENMEFPLWLDQVYGNSNFDMTVISHVQPRDLLHFAEPEYYWNYDNPAVQQLIAEGDSAAEADVFIEKYQEVEQIVADEAVLGYLFLLPQLQVVQSDLIGYQENAFSLSYNVTQLQYDD